MRVPVLFGVETEYAIGALDREGRVLPGHRVAGRILECAAARPHLPGNESGIFLENGGRFYIDNGDHPEYAAPETTNPWDAVRYSFAGDHLIAQLADQVAQDDPVIDRITVRKGNVDYATAATWASHENYLHRSPPADLRPSLIPHLVTRVVFTGGGGFDPTGPFPRFVLSPRAAFVRLVSGASVMGQFALVDGRAQPHCAGFYRQHIVCGDANLSQLAMFLRIGTTALVVALIDAGCARAEEVRLADPLAALVRVSRDRTLGRTLPLASGRQVTALEIQRHYLRQARAHLQRLPAWAGAVCDVWEDTLDRLDLGPEAVADRLDWAIKLAIHRHRLTRPEHGEPTVRGATPCGGVSRPWRSNPAWRAELCEVDTRFGQVHPAGLFEALDRAGVLRHRLAGIDPIGQAISTPPPDGRASIRGRVVTRLGGQPGPPIWCGWDRVRDAGALRVLDLSNPFADTEAWHADAPTADALVEQLSNLIDRPASPSTAGAIRHLADRLAVSGTEASLTRTGAHAIALNNCAFTLRNAMRLAEAECLLRAALAIDLAVRPQSHPKLPHRRNNLAVVLLMQHRLAEAREQVVQAWQQTGSRYDLTSARVLTTRLLIAWIAHEPCDVFLGQLKTHLAIRPLSNLADVDRQTQIGPVLAVLGSRMQPEQVALLRAIVGVINGQQPLRTLETLSAWRDAPALPLDMAWPAERAA